MDKIIETYDTTLRFATFEGSEGIKLEERLAIIRMLDSMGITYIDIGTPENSEEYDRFLKQALELQLESAVLTPFIRAKDCGRRIGMEPAVLKILEMDAQTVCVEGECSEYVIRDEGKMRLEENLWQVSGSCDLEQLSQALGITFPEDQEFDTLGGLVFAQLSVIPSDGEELELDAYGLHIKVLNFTDRRVERALVSKLPTQPEESSGH